MSQIKCPKCGEVFTIDESNYNSIVKQIRDHEFSEEIARREKSLQDKLAAETRLKLAEAENRMKEAVDRKEQELTDLKHEKELMESEYNRNLTAELTKRREEYETKLNRADTDISNLQNQIKLLQEKISHAEEDKNNAVSQTKAEAETKSVQDLAEYKSRIIELESELKNAETVTKEKLQVKESEKALAVQEAIAKLKEENDQIVNNYRVEIDMLKNDAMLKEENLKETFQKQIESKDREIANQKELVEQYKDFKVRQSTKMIGESLEQHCSYEFNRVRMGMFPNSYFEKDNDARTGSKGDFIFKDYADSSKDTEIISIMFEMKNEADATATKHRNEDFFKELDKDRNEKKCEYAILVSMLELDNDLYNEGIVDVSYRYPKMYVIRPQFFIPIITILRNAAMNSAEYQRQLMIERSNNLDITHFEENMNDFKERFGKNYELASRRFQEAIEDIDKTIKDLEKTKKALLSSENNLRLANDKAQDLTIKRLTRNAPSLREKFEEVKKEKNE